MQHYVGEFKGCAQGNSWTRVSLFKTPMHYNGSSNLHTLAKMEGVVIRSDV